MKPKTEEINHQLAKPSTVKLKKEKLSLSDQHAGDHSNDHEEPPLGSNPTPLNLEAFLPWVCIQWECSRHVSVKRVTLAPYVSKREKSNSSRLKSAKSKQSESIVHASEIVVDVDVKSAGNKSDELDDTVQITTMYDIKGTLVEIALHKQHDVPLKVIHAISFCFPYHTSLTKLSFSDGGLTSCLLQEICKILPNSNITDLNLSGNYLPEGNYYILFDQSSQLRCLSLKRCSLNDVACSNLMAKIERGHSIMMLNLSSNDLTDESARAIGQVLRLNRSLVHLNISGNRITSDGAHAILASLTDFPLTSKEIMEMRRRKMVYVENKLAIFSRCLEDTLRKRQSGKRLTQTGKPLKSSPVPKTEKPLVEIAERMTAEIVGEFNDPLNCDGTISKKEHLYCTGNFALCSLNMSHNNLDYFSVKRICQVLKYQSECIKPGETGLLRIIIEGNPFPEDVPEYFQIDELLRSAVLKNTQATKPQKINLK